MPSSLSARDALIDIRRTFGETARIYVPGVAAEPLVLADALRAEPELAAGHVFSGIWIPGVNGTDWSGFHPDSRSEQIFLGPEWRAGFEQGRTRFLPLTYTQAWRWLEASPVDAAFVTVSPPDAQGRASLGGASDFTPALWARARCRYAIINPNLIAMNGAPEIALSDCDGIIEADTALPGYDAGALAPEFEAIAGHVSGLVQDSDAVQFGLGKVQLAVLPALHAHKRLNIHSGMVSDPLLALLDGDGIASMTTGAILGSDGLHRRLGSDNRLTIKTVRQTHFPGAFENLHGFCAINSLIEVDLFGQGNGEFVDGRQVSGGGGLLDFARGAQIAPAGRAVFALVSTARKGTVSRIVPRLATGAATLTRSDIAIVVTEHGVAHLDGLDIDSRAQALISIAAPQHQGALQGEWDAMRRAM
ncbi:MAG: acetyl-CoA hydrolase/transferase C-terminal domain-containing protein [Caulobacterales bacterium]|uniref:acetyl-CoA hydrolase/transferase C-terminal domain-containing protein n=1 Tax=Glycocaulis sp. TaxID=1969725 RepID=UPI003F9FE577